MKFFFCYFQKKKKPKAPNTLSRLASTTTTGESDAGSSFMCWTPNRGSETRKAPTGLLHHLCATKVSLVVYVHVVSFTFFFFFFSFLTFKCGRDTVHKENSKQHFLFDLFHNIPGRCNMGVLDPIDLKAWSSSYKICLCQNYQLFHVTVIYIVPKRVRPSGITTFD